MSSGCGWGFVGGQLQEALSCIYNVKHDAGCQGGFFWGEPGLGGGAFGVEFLRFANIVQLCH
jgi:hypothetical protein